MPVHPHLRNLPVLSLTKDRPSRIDLFPRAPAPERAAELRRKPRPRRVNLARRKIGFGLIQRDVLPIGSDRRYPRSGVLNGVSRNTASSVKTEQIASTSPRSHPLPNVSINALYSLFMRANILLA